MAELQSLCEEHFPVGLSSSLIGVGGSTESESMNKNSYEYKIHKMNISCRRQLHLPAGVSTHTASPSLFSSSGSRADLSIQLSEPSLASGTSYAASSIHSHTPKRSSQLDAKAIKLRRSYFKESVLASKVLYPKEVDVPMTTAAVPPPEDQDDDYNYNYTEAHSEPEADSLQGYRTTIACLWRLVKYYISYCMYVYSGVFLSSVELCGENSASSSSVLQPALRESEEAFQAGRNPNFDDHAGIWLTNSLVG